MASESGYTFELSGLQYSVIVFKYLLLADVAIEFILYFVKIYFLKLDHEKEQR